MALGGTITTIAGNGDINSTGDGGPAINAGVPFPSAVAVDSTGGVYVTEPMEHVVRKITPDGADRANQPGSIGRRAAWR